MAERRPSLAARALEIGADYLGVSTRRDDELESLGRELAEAAEDVGTLRRDMRQMGYQSMNWLGHQPRELTPRARFNIVAKAWVAWSEDPQAGAAIDLRNAFVFGRGVPKPQAHDDDVEEVIDRTWKDPQNRRILTSHAALMEKGIDLGIQSNLFFLFFGVDDSESADGRVRLGLAEHDTIVNAVRHPDERMRILYWKGHKRHVRWDWGKGEYVVDKVVTPETIYYEALDAFATDFDDAVDATDLEDGGLGTPPGGKLAPGKLYHLCVNKGSEQIFGVPRFKRLLRWFTAYEQIMKTSVDLMKAAASVYMKATTRGGRQQLARASQQVTRRASPLTQLAVEEFTGSTEFMPTPPGAGPSVLFQNAGIDYEPFKIDPHAADSAQLASQARMQVSAGTAFPPWYTGDATSGNLATATSVELPVLKIIEEEQEVWESLFRTLTDLAIKRAIDTGWLSEYRELDDKEKELLAEGHEPPDYDPATKQVKRDLGYDFSLPNPLRRVMSELVAAVATIAAEFDPQNTNVEMQRFLFGLVLEQAFDIKDPKRIVMEIYPPNFEPTPAPGPVVIGPDGKPVQAAPPTTQGADGKGHPAESPYGAERASATPEKVEEAGPFTSMLRELEESANRGLPPRPDDKTFEQQAASVLEESARTMRELIAEHAGSGSENSGAHDSG